MSKRAIDRGTIYGITLAVLGIVTGFWLDGGNVSQILQPTAALIVLGGTLGAVLIQFPFETVTQAVKLSRHVLFDLRPLSADYVDEIVSLCLQSRRRGLHTLDPQLARIKDPFLRKSLTLAVDGLSAKEIRALMEVDLDIHEEGDESVAAVLEAAGGFAPTLGIIGAVLGLIQVMQKMDNIAQVGTGIAVAFVSTLYGIGVANLIFLPLAGKLRARMRERQMMREMTLEAVISIVEGISARMLRERLKSYLTGHNKMAVSAAQPEPVAVAQ